MFLITFLTLLCSSVRAEDFESWCASLPSAGPSLTVPLGNCSKRENVVLDAKYLYGSCFTVERKQDGSGRGWWCSRCSRRPNGRLAVLPTPEIATAVQTALDYTGAVTHRSLTTLRDVHELFWCPRGPSCIRTDEPWCTAGLRKQDETVNPKHLAVALIFTHTDEVDTCPWIGLRLMGGVHKFQNVGGGFGAVRAVLDPSIWESAAVQTQVNYCLHRDDAALPGRFGGATPPVAYPRRSWHCEYANPLARVRFKTMAVDAIAATGYEFSQTTETLRLECAAKCKGVAVCGVYAYNADTQDCRLYHYLAPANVTGHQGYRTYEKLFV